MPHFSCSVWGKSFHFGLLGLSAFLIMLYLQVQYFVFWKSAAISLPNGIFLTLFICSWLAFLVSLFSFEIVQVPFVALDVRIWTVFSGAILEWLLITIKPTGTFIFVSLIDKVIRVYKLRSFNFGIPNNCDMSFDKLFQMSK